MSQRNRIKESRKTPIIGRTFALAALLFGTPLTANAQLTEGRVIELVEAQDPEVRAARASASMGEGLAASEAAYPNPSLSWDREHYPGSGAEDAFLVQIPIDLSGRRSARRAIVRADVARGQSETALTQSHATQNALLLFYDALIAEERQAAKQALVSRLEEAARVLELRLAEGTVSGYESNRLALEVELARSQLREAEASRVATRAELLLLLGQSVDATSLEGDLSVRSPAPGASRPSMELRRQSLGFANDAHDSAGSSWIPELSIQGGLLLSSAEETRLGYAVGVEIALPLFSRGQGLRLQTQARVQLAQAEIDLAERSVQIQLARSRSQFDFAAAELTTFREATEDRAERLLAAAESAYREGRRTVIELLDAQRARALVDERRLELVLAAKQAEVRLRAAMGEFE